MIREIITLVFWTRQKYLFQYSHIYGKKMASFLGQRFERVFRKALKYRGAHILPENSIECIIKDLMIFSQSIFFYWLNTLNPMIFSYWALSDIEMTIH